MIAKVFPQEKRKKGIKEHPRLESSITPLSIRKPSTGHTGPAKYIKVQVRKMNQA